ncbi:Hydrogenase formation protein [Desulfonema limicola]|uniref:Hydrogenase formation protein n=1 Tax=Desulfonema limicola TaxID=45656 RepID=A0A975B335_9BACT|nr:hydrogenase formation protein HypD [Desulfonema limicola]QTA77888.1 Hydrogenase formation protein [Desulfonema limicola]
MSIKHAEEYRDLDLSQKLISRIRALSKKKICLMEVCGTHTMSIFRNGIRSVLPDTISLLSGPGCPVCVTDQSEIDAFISIAKMPGVIAVTFGDLLRVPGTGSSLEKERGNGMDVRVVYSTFDAVKIAQKNPDKKVVFLGVGFETTAPTIAASILSAYNMNLENYMVFSAHKRVMPALFALMNLDNVHVDGFILPGHVSVIIGTNAYQPFYEKYKIPLAVTGFEPVDILNAVLILVSQIETNTPKLENAYPRAVNPEGNPKAGNIMNQVFEYTDASWRGMGIIPQSGLKIRKEFKSHDAQFMLHIQLAKAEEPKGCACGSIITGAAIPPECPLYKTVCTPINPIGPCMVSSEGTCAAYYRYNV